MLFGLMCIIFIIKKVMKINYLWDWVFYCVYKSNFVYNICWEDFCCDCEFMVIDVDSEIVMIISVGCNVFDYLLDVFRVVYCVDMNFW